MKRAHTHDEFAAGNCSYIVLLHIRVIDVDLYSRIIHYKQKIPVPIYSVHINESVAAMSFASFGHNLHPMD